MIVLVVVAMGAVVVMFGWWMGEIRRRHAVAVRDEWTAQQQDAEPHAESVDGLLARLDWDWPE